MSKRHIVGNHMSRLIYTFQKAINRGAGQTAWMRRLVGLCLCCAQTTKSGLLARRGPYGLNSLFVYLFCCFTSQVNSVLDSRPKGRGFEPHRRHCVVVLEQDTFILA